jgi:hypothetical protein
LKDNDGAGVVSVRMPGSAGRVCGLKGERPSCSP